MTNPSTINVSDVYVIDGKRFVIVGVPQRKNQNNYKGLDDNGQVFRIPKLVIELSGKFEGQDKNRAEAHLTGNLANEPGMFSSGDEVIINAPSNKSINGKTAYVVKVNQKSIQVVIPRVGAWNITKDLLVKTV